MSFRCPFPVRVAIVVMAMRVPAVLAGHPMLSEDTGTQGTGNAELELGYDWSGLNGRGSLLFQPQLSYGATPALDLIVQPSWLITDVAPQGRARAFGDTNLDVKWRFYGAAPWSLGIRGGFELPTAEENLGLPHGRVAPHAILVATADYAPITLDTNLGLTHAPADPGGRSNLYHLSVAALYAHGESISFVFDAAIDTNPAATGPAYQDVALVGVIFTAHPGLDIDAGYRTRLDPVGPAQQWLVGFTFRGAP